MNKFICQILSIIIVANATGQLAVAAPSENPSQIAAGMTIADVQKKYPNAQIKTVSPENFEREVAAQEAKRDVDKCGRYRTRYTEATTANPNPEQTNLNGDPGINFNSYNNWGGSSSNDKDLLIIVAVIGVVVVAAVLVYAVVYLVEMAAQGIDCRGLDDFGYRFTHISDHSYLQDRSGNLNGLYYTRNYYVPFGTMGLTAEAGHHSIELDLAGVAANKNYNGGYLMIGPSFSFLFGERDFGAFQIELLGGTSTEKQIGLMSTLRFGVAFNITPSFTAGINLGAALIDLKDSDNYLNSRDQLNYLSGAAVSMRF